MANILEKARLAAGAATIMLAGLSTPAGAGGGYGMGTGGTELSYGRVDIAGTRETLGIGRIFGNDWYGVPFGDRYDRWRTGHIQLSFLRGPRWTGALPSQPFEVMEYRLRGEIIAPDNLAVPAPGDRLYAPSWTIGASTHFAWSNLDVVAGADIVVTGPQTGIMPIHSEIHQLFGNNPINLASADRLPNGVFLDAHAEISQGIPLSFGEVRPFAEVRAGVETLARVGADVTIGRLGQGGLRLRDQVTGQRVAGINGSEALGGWSFLLGADSAWVANSVYMPSDLGPAPVQHRHRVRAGVNFGVGDSNLFYGVTYLSEEFEGQPEGQVAGTLSVDIRF